MNAKVFMQNWNREGEMELVHEFNISSIPYKNMPLSWIEGEQVYTVMIDGVGIVSEPEETYIEIYVRKTNSDEVESYLNVDYSVLRDRLTKEAENEEGKENDGEQAEM